MRKLIITREKTYVACLMTMKVYIEDHVAGNTEIDGVLCRKLGTLKNGEHKAFEIDDSAARVYVIQDKLSKNFCNEFFDIPEGSFDVALKGKNHYNPMAGNPFRFEGTANEDVLKNRKKTFRKTLIFMIFCMLIGIVIGFAGEYFKKAEPETFTKDGVSITLTDQFTYVEKENFVACYGDGESYVLISKEEFSLFPEKLTLEEYGKLMMSESPDIEFYEYEGLYCTDYVALNEDSEESFSYFVAIYETDDAFWIANFASLTSEFESHIEEYIEWAKSITFE